MRLSLAAAALISILSIDARAAGPDKGTFYQRIHSDPTTLNVLTFSDATADEIDTYIYDTLLTRNENTWDWEPELAEKYEISKDGTTFTFHLREGVKFHDGKPMTAEDVKYSFDVYFERRFIAPQRQVYLESIKDVKVIDPRTIQFTTKDKYFKNFEAVATLSIVPRHFFGTGDPKDPKFNKTTDGTGPYTLEEWSKGQRVVLKKNPGYWGANIPYWKDRFHSDRLYFRIIKEDAVAQEMLKKGDIDFDGLTPEQYMQLTREANAPKIEAVKVENSAPANFAYGFIGWNNKSPIFRDKDVRMAMSMLVNRDLMIEKFRFGMSEKATGPFGNKNPSSSPQVKAVEFDPKGALALLEKDGWKLGPKGLSKVIDGRDTPLEFTLLHPSQDVEKYFTIIKEDMRKVGITMNIKYVEWTSFVKLMDERKFDAMSLSWTGTLDPDPKQIFHSASIPAPGSNFVSYSNPEVDKLIDQARGTMDAKARLPLMQKVHELIAADQPYSFLFNRKYSLYANTKRIKKPFGPTLKFDLAPETWLTE